MSKSFHEIRDPIHVFVRLDSDEREVLDSRPFQRLRHIHQLGMTYLLYPGATHRRFEHSLGVMELASRIFDVVTRPDKITDQVRALLPELTNRDKLRYWRRVLRMAALCHDLGHLPFSHAAEKDLLPDGWNHERLTQEIICGKEMRAIWEGVTPPLRTEDIAKLAVGPEKAHGLVFSDWETILSEIIGGDAFGADRMDYLIRDSHHTGVAYGKFDHYRLIDTMRILPAPPLDVSEEEVVATGDLALGVEEGGLHSAEALLLARYFMFSQVYLHPVRRIYDIHLKDFLRDWLPAGGFSANIEEHVAVMDNEISAAISQAAGDLAQRGHTHARRIARHEHFKLLYQPTRKDLHADPKVGTQIFDAAAEYFGTELVRHDEYSEKKKVSPFPVLTAGGEVFPSPAISQVLGVMPSASVNFVFVERALIEKAVLWLKQLKWTGVKKEGEAQ